MPMVTNQKNQKPGIFVCMLEAAAFSFCNAWSSLLGLNILYPRPFFRGRELCAHSLLHVDPHTHGGWACTAASASPSQEQLCDRWPFLSRSWDIFSTESGTHSAAAACGRVQE